MAASGPHSRGVRNRILLKLEGDGFAALAPHLERVELRQGQTIHAPAEPIDFVYFVETGFISVVAVLEDGQPLEIGLIGAEGLAGAAVALGVDRSFAESMVQLSGEALRMPTAIFLEQLKAHKTLEAAVLRYAHALHVQVAQTAVCNARHSLDQRLARWLLAALDRGVTSQLPLTQEFLSMMLGVRRSTVTVAAGMLQKAGLIEYRHGRISISDRPGLEDAACECYGVVAAEYRRLLD